MNDVFSTRMRKICLVGRGVWIELLRRQDLYVCALLMGMFLAGVSIVRIVGIDAPATGTFMLQMGLSLASIVAHVLLMLFALRQLPTEIENRTLYPLLARPVSRSDVFWGKWIFVFMGGIIVYLLFTVIVWLSVPKLESYEWLTFFQMVIFHFFSLILLAAMAMCFSLVFSRGMAGVIVGAIYFGGAYTRRIITTVSDSFEWVAIYIPDFGMLDLTTRYTDGIPALPALKAGLLLIYALGFTCIFLLVGRFSFERKRL